MRHGMLWVAHEGGVVRARTGMAKALSKDVRRVHWADWRDRRIRCWRAFVLRKAREAYTVGVVSLCAERHGHLGTEDGGRTQGPAGDVEGNKVDKGREGVCLFYRRRVKSIDG